jgi:hypothetical protein
MSKIFTIERYLHAFPERPDTHAYIQYGVQLATPGSRDTGWCSPGSATSEIARRDMHIIKKGKKTKDQDKRREALSRRNEGESWNGRVYGPRRSEHKLHI